MAIVREIRPGVLVTGQGNDQQPPAAEAPPAAGNVAPAAANDEPRHGGRDGGGGNPPKKPTFKYVSEILLAIVMGLSGAATLLWSVHNEKVKADQAHQREMRMMDLKEKGISYTPSETLSPSAVAAKKVEEKSSPFPSISLWPATASKAATNQEVNRSDQSQCTFSDFHHDIGKTFETTMLSSGMSCRYSGRKTDVVGLYWRSFGDTSWRIESCDGSEVYDHTGFNLDIRPSNGNGQAVQALLRSGKCVKLSVDAGSMHVGYVK